jgi:hypothetical protein
MEILLAIALQARPCLGQNEENLVGRIVDPRKVHAYKSSHQDLEKASEASLISSKLESDHFSEDSEEEILIEENLVPLVVD